MGGNQERRTRGGLALLCAALVVGGWTAGGATLAAEGFATTGQGYADWYWLHPQSHAQWDFFGLPGGTGPHIAVEAFLCLALPNGSMPSEIEVRFLVGTGPGQASGLRVARLARVQANEGYALYFGQVFISRREIAVGSRLTVRLDGSTGGLPVGVHPHSVRVTVGPGGGATPAELTVAPNGGSVEDVHGTLAAPVAAVSVRTLPDSTEAGAAPFLSPGTYSGSLGWRGPYDTPIGKGVYRVHLRAGEVVTLRVETAAPCLLVLMDPMGRKVGEVEGSSWLGLEYRATTSGAWQIHIVCREGGPRFAYSVTLGIRR